MVQRCRSTNTKNSVYGGYIPYGDELHDGEHQGIIDKERYHRIGDLLASAVKNGRRYGSNPDYLLRGILHCRCGGAMTPASTRKKDKLYRYYRCVSRDKKGKKKCDATQIPAQAIEDFVVDHLRKGPIGGTLATQVSKSLEQDIKNKLARLNTERQKLPAEIAKLSDKARKLVEKLTEINGLGSKMVEDRINNVGLQITQAESRLNSVERSLAQLDRIAGKKEGLTKSIENFDLVWDTMTPENRLRMMGILIKKVDLDEKKDTIAVTLTDLNLSDVDSGNDSSEIPAPQRIPHRQSENTKEATV